MEWSWSFALVFNLSFYCLLQTVLLTRLASNCFGKQLILKAMFMKIRHGLNMLEYQKKIKDSRGEYYASWGEYMWVYASNARRVQVEYSNILNNASQILASIQIFE